MTRSSKTLAPKALAHDRSISRNGRDASLKKNGFLGWGDLSGQHLSHSFEDELFEPLDDDHFAAEDQPEKAKGATEDSKVDALWLRLVDRSLEMAAKMMADDEKAEALAVRKNSHSASIDLASIARSSLAVAHPPPFSPSTSPETATSLMSSSFNSRASTSSTSTGSSVSYK